MGFLGRLLWSLMNVGLLLTKNALQSLIKSVLIPLGLTEAASTSGSGSTALIIPNKETDDVMKFAKFL